MLRERKFVFHMSPMSFLFVSEETVSDVRDLNPRNTGEPSLSAFPVSTRDSRGRQFSFFTYSQH